MKKIFTLIMMLVATLGIQAQDATTWTVAGEKAILGVGWAPGETANDMTTTDEVNFTLIKEHMMVKAKDGGYGYKVVMNHEWEGENNPDKVAYPEENALLDISEDGEYKITFTFNVQTKEVNATAEKTGEYVAPVVDNTYTVAGVDALCGSSWNPEDTSNDMSSEDGVNYTLVKTDLVLEAKVGYTFKVVANHSWDEGAYPNENATLKVDENGKYTVTFKFNSETFDVSAEAVKTGDVVIDEKVWTIAGAAAVLGSSWEPKDESNDMIDLGDGTFILVKNNVALEADIEYEFKVLANHSWTENYGKDGVPDGTNCYFMVEEDGNYDVTFFWNYESKLLYADATPADPSSVKNVKNATANSFVTYNLQGQRIKAGFRGIVIRNGHKMVVK